MTKREDKKKKKKCYPEHSEKKNKNKNSGQIRIRKGSIAEKRDWKGHTARWQNCHAIGEQLSPSSAVERWSSAVNDFGRRDARVSNKLDCCVASLITSAVRRTR